MRRRRRSIESSSSRGTFANILEEAPERMHTYETATSKAKNATGTGTGTGTDTKAAQRWKRGGREVEER
jgi:hypothetical protein